MTCCSHKPPQKAGDSPNKRQHQQPWSHPWQYRHDWLT